jgi:leader peptidase (prepilin peptidase) / N-methyltransferase
LPPSPDAPGSSAYPTGDIPVRWAARAAAGACAGVLAALMLAHFGVNARGIISTFLACVLVALSISDLERRIIPNRVVLPATAIVLAAQLAFFPQHALEWVIASLGTALFLFLPSLLRPGALGMGDVKLGLLLGAGLGHHVVTGLLLGLFALWPVAFFLFVRHGAAAARKTAVPLGPFLAAGAIAALLLSS